MTEDEVERMADEHATSYGHSVDDDEMEVDQWWTFDREALAAFVASIADTALKEAGEKEVKKAVGNLLARIHRDGGHYQAEPGTLKALEDAEREVVHMLSIADTAGAISNAKFALEKLDKAHAILGDNWCGALDDAHSYLEIAISKLSDTAGAKPVAWRYDTRQGFSYHSQQLDHFYTGWDGEYAKGEPLYAAPRPAAQDDAVKSAATSVPEGWMLVPKHRGTVPLKDLIIAASLACVENRLMDGDDRRELAQYADQLQASAASPAPSVADKEQK